METLSSNHDEILIIEQDPKNVEALVPELIRQCYRVRVAKDDESGLAEMKKEAPGLVILGPPTLESRQWELCRAIKGHPKTKSVLVVILTGLAKEENRLRAFELGADEYLTKPYSLKELVARIRALFRRAKMLVTERNDAPLQLGRLLIDVANHEARRDGKVLPLTHTEFALLKFFAQNPGRVFSREQLIHVLWGDDRFVEYRNVDVHVYSLRKRIEPNPSRPSLLLTVRNIGYKFNG